VLAELVLQPGESFTVEGTVEVAAGETHRDNVIVNADGVISGEEIDDEDPTTYEADPTYAIGDYVWIDENGNGIQDEGETPLEDVTVVLYDGEGNELDRTETNEHGRYLFDDLPAGEYEVGIELTEEQAALYEFTDPTRGDDPAQDSNAGEHGRTGVFTLGPDSPLVADEDYEYASVSASEGIDPTWDAGVVLIPEDAETPPPADPTPTEPADPAGPTDPADPAGPGTDTPEGDDEGPGGALPMTGAHLALLLTAAGLILLVIGGLLYARHRKGINA
jgi:LPXTG-motif cell wall-anchored protein